MVICAGSFIGLERGFLGKMVGADVLLDVVVETGASVVFYLFLA